MGVWYVLQVSSSMVCVCMRLRLCVWGLEHSISECVGTTSCFGDICGCGVYLGLCEASLICADLGFYGLLSCGVFGLELLCLLEPQEFYKAGGGKGKGLEISVEQVISIRNKSHSRRWSGYVTPSGMAKLQDLDPQRDFVDRAEFQQWVEDEYLDNVKAYPKLHEGHPKVEKKPWTTSK